MRVRFLTASLVAFAIFLSGKHVHAQEQPPSAWGAPDGILEFDTDWRWFETVYNADLEELSPKKRANRGYYATFDRMHLMVTRPEHEDSIAHQSLGGDRMGVDGEDWGWGNRIDLGFIGENDRGWGGTYWSLTGPNGFEETLQYRANVINDADPRLPGNANQGGGGGGGAGGTTNQFGQLLPSFLRNNPDFNERIYVLRDSLNVLHIQSGEINRIYRLEPYRLGGILEPMFGFRHIQMRDVTQNDTYTVQPGTLVTETPGTLQTTLRENLISNIDNNDNIMFGGQVGFRYIKFHNRMMHSLDFRAMALQNFQYNEFIVQDIETHYPAGSPGDDNDPIIENTSLNRTHRNGDEFVIGFDVRAQTSFHLTRSLSLRGGIQVLDFGRGILRGPVRGGADNRLAGTTAISDQHVFLVGYSFGLTLNR